MEPVIHARHMLSPHSDDPFPPVTVAAGGARRGAFLGLSHVVTGSAGGLWWHGEGSAGRADGLWEHGCLEAFVRRGDGAYIEINLAPTARWAAYRFDARREGMRPADVRHHRQDWVRRAAGDRLEMHALLELPPDFAGEDWSVGLTAILEGADGARSYRALAHGAGAPDFHDPACFLLTLPAPMPR